MEIIVGRGLAAIAARIGRRRRLDRSGYQRAAVDMLMRLHRAGHSLDADEVRAWALADRWEQVEADTLAELAGAIGAGEPMSLDGGPHWPDDVIERLASAGPTRGPG